MTLHVVFKTHLDVGFTDLTKNVVALYLDHFIPRALSLAEETRQGEHSDRFIWTVGSWLVWEFLEKKGFSERRRMEQAIERGDIVWHALPFTMHSELLDASLFKHGLSLSQRLDERFGRKTVAAKCTDVPGHTRGIIPLLAEAGVTLLHIGVNPTSAVPRLPPVFRWRHPGGAEVIVIYSDDYGKTTTIPELDDGLSICFTGDNLGPQKPAEVEAVFAELRLRHPGAQPVGSTLNAFAQTLEIVRSTLPVVEAEIGDTWIHGVGTDPAKVAAFRDLMRLRRQWIEIDHHSPFEPGMDRFSQKLLLVAEHTWGLDIKKCLGTEPGETRTYDRDFEPETFRNKRHLPNYQRMEASWAEQRDYLHQAAAALDDTSRNAQAGTAIQRHLNPAPPVSTTSWKSLAPGEFVSNDQYEIGFDAATGAISHLVHRPTKTSLADASHMLARFRYDLYSSSDYAVLWNRYNRNKRETRWWAEQDFLKPGLEKAVSDPRQWFPRVAKISRRSEVGLTTCQIELAAPAEAERFGCPAKLTLTVSTTNDSPTLRIDFSWAAKQANRVPEAMWLGFCPPRIDPTSVTVRKLGQWINPRDVVANGGRRLHAIEDKIRFGLQRKAYLEIEALDTPLFAPGTPSLVRFTNRKPKIQDGGWFNLHNNTWGTNFPLWYEGNGHCRFRLTPAIRKAFK